MKSSFCLATILVLALKSNAAPIIEELAGFDMAPFFPQLNDTDFINYGGVKYVKSSAHYGGIYGNSAAAGLNAETLQKREAIPRPLLSSIDRRIDKKWYPDMETILNNNCYNFATNVLTNTFAQPGDGSGMPPALDDSVYRDCKRVREGAIKDGLIPTANSTLGDYKGDKSKCHYLAAMVGTYEFGSDYHWFRMMRPGIDKVTEPLWFHKPGSTIPLTKDFSGKPIKFKDIFYPKTKFDSGIYSQFCGLFLECGQKLTIR
jgi:hypothetical protein